jgi:hypothetical protein
MRQERCGGVREGGTQGRRRWPVIAQAPPEGASGFDQPCCYWPKAKNLRGLGAEPPSAGMAQDKGSRAPGACVIVATEIL